MTLRRVPPAAWLLIAGFVLCAAVNLPGHLSYDSVMQLNEGRRGFYANWHPPMMSWLLGVFDWLWPGTALFALCDMALFFGSLGALLFLSSPARGAREAHDRGGDAKFTASFIVLALVLLTPQVLLYQGIVWKDVLFANLSIAGFAALAVAGEKWERRRLRFGLLVAAFLLLSVATLVRQNGGVVLPAAAAALAWIAWQKSSPRKIRATFLYGMSALAGAAVAVVAMHAALALRIPGDPSPAVAFRLLQFYDLIGALKAKPALALPYFDDDDTDLEQLMRTDGVRLYTPERNDTLAQSARLQRAYFQSPDETIPEEWERLVAVHTGLYLRVRAEVFRWIVLTPDLAACRPVFSGIDGPANVMAKLGLAKRFDARDAALDFYAKRFMGTPVFSHAFFLALALIALVFLFARRTPSDIAVAFMLLSTLAFTLSFFVISIACDYRYLYFVDLAAMAAAFHLSLDWRSAWAALHDRSVAISPPARSPW
ncbi:MAG TPA: hypothetical protein VMD53_12565 [Rhizomicrobium sp.]|nr:hypothetical protein [Rhizomicrobium sp.]